MNEFNYDKPKYKFKPPEVIDEMVEELHKWLPMTREEIVSMAIESYYGRKVAKRQNHLNAMNYLGELLSSQGYRCFYCGRTMSAKKATLDHKIPMSRGGVNELPNYVASCRPCNEDKGSMTIYEYLGMKEQCE